MTMSRLVRPCHSGRKRRTSQSLQKSRRQRGTRRKRHSQGASAARFRTPIQVCPVSAGVLCSHAIRVEPKSFKVKAPAPQQRSETLTCSICWALSGPAHDGIFARCARMHSCMHVVARMYEQYASRRLEFGTCTRMSIHTEVWKVSKKAMRWAADARYACKSLR